MIFNSLFYWFNVLIIYLTVLCFFESNAGGERTQGALVWGPGLRPHEVVLPARYFFIQPIDNKGSNISDNEVSDLKAEITSYIPEQRCRVWINVLRRYDGSYIVRYKMYETCPGIVIRVRYKGLPVAGFPLKIEERVFSDDCNCPIPMNQWKKNLKCPQWYRQITEDFQLFPKTIDMDVLRKEIISKFNKRGSMSLCHYVVVKNEVYRQCYGQHVGFHVFMDATLLSLSRKVLLPNMEFFVNLGDWPLEKIGPDPLPIFSWCGSEDTADIVMPTYDITESTLECMGRVQLDMLSVQGNTGPKWKNKEPKCFWRGRDSRLERLQLIDISRANPGLFNASLTNFFFFRDKQEKYGPKQPHVSFFEFFQYKYQFAIDGTVAPYRMPYLLAGDSLVIKQNSPYYEHFYKDLQSGQHFLDVQRNLSDLVEKIEWARANDELARQIAENGAQYARENLMPTHIFCYYAALFQVWSDRLSSPVIVLDGMELVKQTDSPCDCGPRHTEL